MQCTSTPPIASSMFTSPDFTRGICPQDVLAKQLIEDGPEGPEEDDPKVQRKLERKTKTKTYNDEQEDVRKAFLAAVDDEDEDEDEDEEEGLLKKKVKTKEEKEREAKEDKEIEEKIANKRKEDDAAKVCTSFGIKHNCFVLISMDRVGTWLVKPLSIISCTLLLIPLLISWKQLACQER